MKERRKRERNSPPPPPPPLLLFVPQIPSTFRPLTPPPPRELSPFLLLQSSSGPGTPLACGAQEVRHRPGAPLVPDLEAVLPPSRLSSHPPTGTSAASSNACSFEQALSHLCLVLALSAICRGLVLRPFQVFPRCELVNIERVPIGDENKNKR